MNTPKPALGHIEKHSMKPIGTPVPWKREFPSNNRIAPKKHALNDGYVICECFGPDAEDNAARIVHCVNSMATLRTILWPILARQTSCPGPLLKDELDALRGLIGGAK